MASVAAPHRPGLRSLGIMISSEAKMVARDTAGLVVPLGMPLLALLTTASTATGEILVDGLTALELFVMPLVIALVMALIGIVNMPSFLASYRRTGVLRRLALTPASPMRVLLAQVVVSALQALLGIGLALGAAAVCCDLRAPAHWETAMAVGGLALLAMYSVGMFVAAIAPTPNSAVAIGLVFFFAFGTLGGLFGGRQALPDALADVGGVLPFGAAIDGLAAAWAGQPIAPESLISLAVTLVVGATGAAILFRWE